jgi:hypothetical protein
MKVAIVGFKEENKRELADAMEKLIVESQCFLFTVVASQPDSLGARWARHNGAPVEYNQDTSLDGLIKSADYFLIWNDGSVPMHRLIFKIMHSGKHGTILGEKYKP